MLTRQLGRTGLEVSAIGLGTWNLGNQWGELTDAEADAIVRAAFDNGMTLFDTAESYGIPNGCSEMRLGRSIKSFRDQITLVSKIGHWGKRTGEGVPKTTADMIRLCGHAICGRLRTDHVDVLLCHEADISEPGIYIEGFEALKDDGFLSHYGISTDNLDVLRRFYDESNGECSVLETDYSLVHKTPENGILEFCAEHGIGVLVRGPLAMGLLSGRYDRSTVFTDLVREGWNAGGSGRKAFEERIERVEAVKAAVGVESLPETAVRYVISHETGPVAIPGATTVEQVVANARAGEATLPHSLYSELRGL